MEWQTYLGIRPGLKDFFGIFVAVFSFLFNVEERLEHKNSLR